MLPRFESFRLFGTNFIQYDFECVGDELPLHDHPFDHAMLVAKGDVVAFGEDGVELKLPEGDRIVFPAGKKHGVRALTKGARIFNIMPPGAPGFS